MKAACRPLVFFTVLAGLACSPAAGQDWNAETLAIASEIPVQDDGRVKPMDTLARFRLLRYSGGRTLKIEDEETGKKQRRPAISWLLDCLFFPERAKSYRMFLVPRFEIIDAIELPHEGKKKRDYYSYRELEPGFDRLLQLGQQYQGIDAKQRTAVQEQILRLAQNVADFSRLAGYLNCVRHTYSLRGAEKLEQLFGGRKEVPLSDLLAKAPAIADLYGKEADPAAAHGNGHGKRTPLHDLVGQLLRDGDRTHAIALFPPAFDADRNAPWFTLGDLINKSFRERSPALDTQYEQVARLERLVAARDAGGDTFKSELGALQQDLQALAEARGQYETVPLELSYYRGNFLFLAQVLFVAAFLIVAVGWFFPANRFMGWAAWGAVAVPAGLLITAITYRCLIRGRPPVSTLYETTLFITATAVVVMLIVELISRQRIAVSLAAVLGAAGMYLANKYELTERVDTMPTLVAVLDTNFWLSTHVTCVVIGYAASLVAAAIAHLWLLGKFSVWLVGRITDRARNTGAFFRTVARMIYGAVCFGLLFSVVGTILGGIWANDSWGRFWGWDPKENGALMICLWQLAILHARMGGYIRNFGLAMWALVLGVITAFSWWHVNHLGVGLHSYGFTDGVLRNLTIFYGTQVLLFTGGLVAWVVRLTTKRAKSVEAPAATTPRVADVSG